jgi:uncharacterized glyoxalase superfamily protein PhnB
MIHQFKKSLQHEREQAILADKFYSEVLHATNIIRYNNDTEHDMEMQRKDIDVQVTIKGTSFNISEKFRDKDFGDLYIEVLSKYPHTMGWMHTGSPDAIVYFTPQAVYWITHKSLKAFCDELLFPAIPMAWYEEIHKSKKTIVSKNLQLKDIDFKVCLIQAHNFDGKPWETIGVSIGFEVLEHFGVKFRKVSKPFFSFEVPNHTQNG